MNTLFFTFNNKLFFEANRHRRTINGGTESLKLFKSILNGRKHWKGFNEVLFIFLNLLLLNLLFE
jgi:hypothetical protein